VDEPTSASSAGRIARGCVVAWGMLPLLLALLAAEGPPLFYWGARVPTLVAVAPSTHGPEASVTEVYAAFETGDLLLRLTWDRPVREAIYLPSGRPVSGRLRAALYLDLDGDARTGLRAGPADLRTGAERRLEIGVLSLGEDPEEGRAAAAVVMVALSALDPGGRRRTLWRSDDTLAPRRVSVHGEWIEVRLPAPHVRLGERPRLVLECGGRAWAAPLRR
jgi:hypothetical protein